MGANPTQAVGVVAFILGFVLLAAGMFLGGSILVILAGLAVLTASAVIFRRAKPWEHQED
jgi:hypothetical protein